MNDAMRGAVMATCHSGLSVLVLLGVVSLDTDQLAGIQLFISNLTVLAGFFWKSGQQQGP